MKRYIKTAIRNIFRYKRISFINLFGLSIGFAIAIIIALFVWGELSFDNFHINKDTVYRLFANTPTGKTSEINVHGADYLLKHIPEIKKIALINGMGMYFPGVKSLKYEDKSVDINDLYYCNADFADVFSFNVLSGDLKEALTTPNSIVLTRSLSKKLFSNDIPLGKVVTVKDTILLTVKALLDDIPRNSSFIPEALLSFESCKNISGYDLENEDNWACDAFLMLNKNSDKENVIHKLNESFIVLLGDDKEAREIMSQIRIDLVPLPEIYFSEPIDFDHLRHGKRGFMFAMLSIGIAILVLALMNFENHIIINGINRAKEFGIKKVNGGSQFIVFSQFIFETVLFCLIAFFIGRLLVEMFLYPFNRLIDYQLNSSLLNKPVFIIISVLFVTILGIFSGLVPSIILSGSNLVGALKNEKVRGVKTWNIQKGLVSFQFVISIAIIIATITICKQVILIHNKELGFSKDEIIEVGLAPLGSKRQSYVASVKDYVNIKNITLMNHFFGSLDGNSMYISLKHMGETKENIPIRWRWVDENFFDATGIQIKESINLKTVKEGWILNETAVERFGITNQPLKATINNNPVIAVVKDFNYASLHSKISPYAFKFAREEYHGGLAIVRLNATDSRAKQQTIAYLKSKWLEMTHEPFTYASLNDKYNALYMKENRLQTLLIYFSVIAIIISALGAYALSVYSMYCRTKEIGIRKVNGAKVSEILAMLNKDFVKWVVIAFVIATPIAYYAMNKWLENFAYKTTLSWWIFALAGVLALGIALLTVSWQSWKAATRNPVEALRYE